MRRSDKRNLICVMFVFGEKNVIRLVCVFLILSVVWLLGGKGEIILTVLVDVGL